MTKRYTNINRIKRSNVLDEFKGYVSGMVNQDNNLTFDKASRIATDLINGDTSSLTNTLLQLSDKEVRDLSDAFLGVDGASYFMKDLFSGIAFSSFSPTGGAFKVFKNLGDSIQIVYEPGNNKVAVVNNILDQAGLNLLEEKSISSAIQTVSLDGEFSTKDEDDDPSNDVYDINISRIAKSGITLAVNKEIGDPHRLTQPSLGAIVFKDGKFGLPTRGQDEIAVFFNMIPNIEMAKCAPYLYVSVVTPGEEDKISLDKYFSFSEEGGVLQSVSSEIKDRVGKKIKNKINSIFGTENYTTAGMELFTSPQTLSNADIRSTPGNQRILEPISSLLSIESLSISNTSSGVALFSTKRATMKLKLHDRSRLRDISPLVSVEEFGQTKIIMEYGWHHPEGDASSDNPIGVFLNSLREGGVFSVIKSDFSFGAKAVDITLELMMGGQNEASRVSAATGLYVQSSVAKPQIEKAISKIIKENQGLAISNETIADIAKGFPFSKVFTDPEGLQNKILEEVRSVTRLAIGEYTSKDSIVAFEDFRDTILYSGLAGGSEDKKKTADAVMRAYNINRKGLQSLNNIISLNEDEKITEKGLNLVRQLSQKIKAFEIAFTADPFITDSESAINRIKNSLSIKNKRSDELGPIADGFLEDMRVSFNTASKNSPISLKGAYTTLGRALLSLVGTSMASIGKYDEVQMLFYPLNDRAAGAHVYTTASMPINTKSIIDAFNEAINRRPDITVKKACSILEKIVRDPQNDVYLLKSEIEKISVLRKSSKSNIISAIKNRSVDIDSGNDGGMVTILNQIASDQDLLATQGIGNNLFTSGQIGLTAALDNEKYDLLTGENLKEFRTKSIKNYEDIKGKKLQLIYGLSDDPNNITDPKFILPNLSFYYETSNPFVIGLDGTRTVDTSRTILKIHVYDSESTPNKVEKLLQRMITSNEIPSSMDELGKDALASIENFNYIDVKNFIKRSMPNITLGTAGGQVTDFTISANTGGKVANTLLVTSMLKNRSNPQNVGNVTPSIDDMKVIPSTATLGCLGMPLLNIGQQIYIDCKTGTTADNIYIVTSVKHEISQGKFATSANLTYAGSATHSNTKEQILKLLN